MVKATTVMTMGLFGKGPTVELKVEGMTCGHCVMRVTKALEDVEGVKRAQVNLDKKSASVTLKNEGSATKEALVAAVKLAGYEAS